MKRNHRWGWYLIAVALCIGVALERDCQPILVGVNMFVFAGSFLCGLRLLFEGRENESG